MMNIGIISLFPEMFSALDCSIPGRAQLNELLALHYWNPRDFSNNKHHSVDDSPYGGGPGMVMAVQPLRDAVHDAKRELGAETKTIYLSPQGKRLTQTAVQEMAQQTSLIFVAGRYEGVDERFIESEVDEEWSLGDYVISGGELAAMVVIDALTRFIPGALGDAESAQQDSFMDSLLDCPHYTRPEEIDGHKVPAVLLSGDHKAIANYRLQQALVRTRERRPDLLEQRGLSAIDKKLLDEYIAGDKHG